MESSEKRTYKFGLLTFVIFGIILMIHGLIFGALEVAQSWLHLAIAILISPFIAFGIGFFLPREISQSPIKHSFLIGLIGSSIFISLTCYLTPGVGSMIGIDPNYSNLIDGIGLGEFISLSIWGIVSSIFASLLGTIFSSFREVESPAEEEAVEESFLPESQQPPAPTQEPETPAQPTGSSQPASPTQQVGNQQSGSPAQQIGGQRQDTPTQQVGSQQPNTPAQQTGGPQPGTPTQQRGDLGSMETERTDEWRTGGESEFPAQSEQREEVQTTEEEYTAVEESELEEERTCFDCGERLRWIDQYEMWYCDNCREYKRIEEEEETEEAAYTKERAEPSEEEDVDVKLCPHCVSELRWVPQYERWYCDNCQQYVEAIEEEDVSESAGQGEAPEKEEEEEVEEEETEITEPCPDCDGEVRWLEEYNRWYCEDCKEYKTIEEE
ncbi:MAG: hypothetical protein V5A88_01640 [Candidatus Thermoplasmatota archaeon]